MSIARKVKIDVDLQTMREVAKELGFVTVTNADVRNYAGRPMSKADLVIGNKTDMGDVGFRTKEDGSIEMIADFHNGHAEDKLKILMPTYYERILRRRGGRFKITDKTETKDKIILTIQR